MGEAEPAAFAALPARRRQRLRRDADGREHLARGRSHRGQYTSPEDFQLLILEAGRIPAERNTTYSRINIKAPLDEFTLEQTPEAEFA